MHSTAHKSVAPPINQPWNMCVSLGYFPLHTLATSRNPVIRPVLVRNNRATRPTTGKLKRFFFRYGRVRLRCRAGSSLLAGVHAVSRRGRRTARVWHAAPSSLVPLRLLTLLANCTRRRDVYCALQNFFHGQDESRKQTDEQPPLAEPEDLAEEVQSLSVFYRERL